MILFIKLKLIITCTNPETLIQHKKTKIKALRFSNFQTSSKTGTLPPTKPVFPPCGTTARDLELQ